MDLDAICRRFDAAKSRRSNWDSIFQQIADRVLPQAATFNVQRADGERRTEYMYDATAALAAQKALAAIATFIWPPNQRYQKLTTSNRHLNRIQAVQAYFDEVTDILFEARYSPRARFESQMGEAGLQFFVFGTGLLFIDEDMRRQAMRYKALHLGQTYIAENSAGVIDTVFRCWSWPLRLIEQRFPGMLPPRLAEKLRQRPDDEAEIVHVVMPREDYAQDLLGVRSMPWVSLYFLPSEKSELEEGGLRSFPFGIMRAMTSPGEVYGRSPAWMALSNIKVLNKQKRTSLQAGERVVDPPLLLPEDGVLQPFSMAPGSLNYGGVSDQGHQLVLPLVTNARLDIGLDMMDKEREIISSAFMLDVFRVLVENPNMTATQTLELLQERATLLSPIGGRIESECLGPLTEREIDILTEAGQLPKPPQELIEAAGEYAIEFTSPMRKAMRAGDGIAIARTLESVMPLAEADPSVLDSYDLPAIARELGEINGLPAKLMRDPANVRARADQRAKQQAMASVVEAAPAVSAAAANLTKMQAAGGRPQL